ncbi:MAG: hypothetical protein M3396_10745, partial [Actinomycetota bacterium]|nr:hypothetical protein [Actinomycetota bacterium]
MFQRFTAGARGVIVGAEQEARRMGHAWVGCEHLLLAVVGSATPVAEVFTDAGVTPEAVEEAMSTDVGTPLGEGDDKAVLATLGIDVDQVRDAAERTFERGALAAVWTCRRRRRGARLRRPPSAAPRLGPPPLTPRAKRC